MAEYNTFFERKLREFMQEQEIKTLSDLVRTKGWSWKWIQSHRQDPSRGFKSKISAARLNEIGITEEELARENARVEGLPITEREYLAQQVNEAISLLSESNGEHIDGRQVYELVSAGTQLNTNKLYPLIREVASRKNLDITFPTRPNRNEHSTGETERLKQRVTKEETRVSERDRLGELRSFYVGKERKKPRITRIKNRNPYFLLGEAYQNLVGSLLSLAHLDDTLYDEVALDYEKQNRKLTRTRNIVDFLALQGFRRSKRQITSDKKKVALYEVKLGRQRQGLIKQVRAQLDAAKARWGNKDISAYIIAGNTREGDQAYLCAFQEACKLLDENNGERIGNSKSGRKFDELRMGLENLEEMVESEEGIEILDYSELAARAIKKVIERYQYITPGKDNRDIQGKKALHKKYGAKEAEEIKALITELKETYGIGISLEGIKIGHALCEIDKHLQLRNLDYGQIKRYEENLFLLQHYLNSRRFRKAVDPRNLEKYDPNDKECVLNKLGDLLRGIVKASYVDGTNLVISDRQRSRAEKIRQRSPKFYREMVHAQDQEALWKDFLPNYRQILDARKKMQVHYEEKGLSEPFTIGKRAIPKHKNSWVLEALQEIGIETNNMNLENPQELEEALSLLEEQKQAYESSINQELTRQSKKASDLKTRLDQLEEVYNSEAYNKASGCGLSYYEGRLRNFGVEDLSRKGLNRTAVKDSLTRRVTGALRKLGVGKGSEPTAIHRKHSEIDGYEKSAFTEVVGGPEKIALKVWGACRAYFEKEEKQKKVRRIYSIYKDFIKEGDLDKTEKELVKYLQDPTVRVIIDPWNHGPAPEDIFRPRESKLANSVARSYLFRDTHIAERYLAAKLLQTTAQAKELYGINRELGDVYLATARKEYKTGRDCDSSEIVENAIKFTRNNYEQAKQELAELEEAA